MIFDLENARKQINITAEEAAKAAGITSSFYKRYESEGKIPCKYIYNIWVKYQDYPIPEDFFCYTSYTLQANMDHHKITQAKLAKLFGFSSQGAISKILSENIPMYEMKDQFLTAFDPMIVTVKMSKDGKLTYITNLSPKGNFMNKRKRTKKGPIKANIKEVIINE